MKNILLLLIIISSLSCSIKKPFLESEEFGGKVFKENNCYAMLREEEAREGYVYQKDFVLEFKDPIFKKVKKVVTLEDIQSYKHNDSTISYVSIQEKASKYLMRNEDLSKSDCKVYTEGFIFCNVEVPERYKNYTKAELEQINYVIIYSKLVKNGTILKTTVDAQPKELKENEFFYEGGYWSTTFPENIHYNCKDETDFRMKDIEQKLVNLGYDIMIDNIFGKKDKAALLDFQQKKGLPEGQLDLETLRALGIYK